MKDTIASRLRLCGGLLTFMDSLWGGIAILGMDLDHVTGLILAGSFVLPLPAYLIDVFLNRGVPIVVSGLFIFRWVALCYAGPAPMFVSPLPLNKVLIVAGVLLQLSRLRLNRARAMV